MAKRNNTPVVITRKDKRLFKTGHVIAALLTGGHSLAYTAAKAATNSGYNTRTRELQAQAEQSEVDDWGEHGSTAPRRRHEFTDADHERAIRAGQAAMRKLAR